jgi:hypothetical protein
MAAVNLLDRAYLRSWAARLNVEADLEDLLAAVGPTGERDDPDR